MSPLDNVTVARTFHQSWDDRDPDGGAAVIADDCEFIDVPRGELQRGPQGYRHDYERWRTAFPDFPPTNRKIEVSYCSVMQIKNGKVISGRDYYDVSTILRQLGLES